MKLTKYAQSCILIETKGKRILVDPGVYEYDEALLKQGWDNIDLVLVTHWHPDHCHEPAVKEILKSGKTTLYSSKEVARTYPDLKVSTVKEGDTIKEEPLTIAVVNAVHGFAPFLKGGKEVHENIGFIIDDGETKAYCTSDTIGFDHDYRCDVICLPVSNHGLTLGPWEGSLFAKATGAKLAIPLHGHNPKHPVDVDQLKKDFDENDMPYQILQVGESVEV